MKTWINILVFIAVCAGAYAQPPLGEELPQRTPEEIARKQNAKLIRELGLVDSAQIDTLFRMHLKYARMREISNTRAEDLERLQDMITELKGILTPEQYEQLMNRQVDDAPRHPHNAIQYRPTQQ